MSSWVRLLLAASQLTCFSLSQAADTNLTKTNLAENNLTETPHASPPNLQETPLDKQEILSKHKIVPKIIAQQPSHVLFGDYEGKEISFGNVFTPEEIKKRPHYLDWPVNGTRALYCLLAIGIDVPSKEEPKLKDFRHWMVGNIPGTDIEDGDEILPYVGAGNFYDEGSHRIIFLVFRQPGNRKIKFYERKLRTVRPIYVSRGNTSTLKMVEKYSFRQAVAANFLTVETGVPQSTTDYYAHTTRRVPRDWEGISFEPKDFGFTFVLPDDSEEEVTTVKK